jgi:YHS domain-containing protein
MKRKNIVTILVVTSILLTFPLILSGCKKKTEMSPSAKPATQASAADVEQTNCPVMGGAIDKNIYTEYKGKKVYFCCNDCKAEFEKNPEKYIAKLPQFKK